jgi:hypothetical protein
MTRNHPSMSLRLLGLCALASAGCDYSGDFLFAGETIDDIRILTGADGDPLIPVDVATFPDLQQATVYAEIGAPQTSDDGGLTVDFIGTGGPICIWVDPETAYWTPAIGQQLDQTARKYSYPDNVFDDGDIDIFAGLSVYYTGSPGTKIGDFVVDYEDSLGNPVPISLAACPNIPAQFDGQQFAGRGAPEYCTIPATDLGISYTILLRTWSTPLDDDRLSFGFLLANGSCNDIRGLNGPATNLNDECVIQGESLTPVGEEAGPFYGFDEVNDAGRIWSKSVELEETFCNPDTLMRRFCNQEVEDVNEAGATCSWGDPPTGEEDRCYCGNPDDTPAPGAG